jgi:phospholipase/carboxylesterase
MNPQSIVVQKAPGRPQQLILLFHGYRANPEDLVPLGERLAAAFPDANVVSVGAPQPTGYPGGLQWFSLDDVTDDNRAERVAGAMPGFLAEIRAWQQESGVTESMTALVGFSQGATMALESSVSASPPAARVIAIAGRFAQLPQSTPAQATIHLLHGKADTVIPYRHTIDAAHRLLDLGGDVTADVFPFVGHGISDEVAELAVQRLKNYVPRRLWDEAMRADQQIGMQE